MFDQQILNLGPWAVLSTNQMPDLELSFTELDPSDQSKAFVFAKIQNRLIGYVLESYQSPKSHL